MQIKDDENIQREKIEQLLREFLAQKTNHLPEEITNDTSFMVDLGFDEDELEELIDDINVLFEDKELDLSVDQVLEEFEENGDSFENLVSLIYDEIYL